jgi:hypothetical protein
MKFNSFRLALTGLFLLLFSFPVKAQNKEKVMQDSLLLYNKLLSPKQLNRDLRLLLDIRRKANSGLLRYRSEKQLDSLYNWAFDEVRKPLRIIDFYKIMLQLADFEGSVHNYTEVDSGVLSFLKRQKSFFPYPLIYIDGQIIFDGQDAPVPVGSRIMSVNGISAVNLMQSFYKYYPADGFTVTKKRSASVDRSFGLNYLLEYGLSDTYQVEYIPPNNNATKKITLPAVSLDQRTENVKKRYSAGVNDLIDYKTQEPYSFKMVRPSVAVLNLRWFGMVTGEEDPGFKVYVRFLDRVFNEIHNKNVTNLIIDIRNNPGGSDPTFEQPVRYLTDHSFKENIRANIIFDPDSLPYEEYFWGVSTSAPMDSISLRMGKRFLKERFPVHSGGVSYQNQKYNPVYDPKSPAFNGNIYLLVNENVASAASHFASLVKAYAKNVTVVGVETVGGYYVHNGHSPLVYELPESKIKTQFSIVYVVQDAPEKPDQPEGRGIIPDYEVWPTLPDFFLHRDTQLEFVLGLIAE